MKPTLIKISISQDGLLPQKSIELGEINLKSFPKKLMATLDFEKVDDDKKRTTFVGILPVFVVIDENSQEIEMELTVSHPELKDKVIDLFSIPGSVPPRTSYNRTKLQTAPKKTRTSPRGASAAKAAKPASKKPALKKTAEPKKAVRKKTSSSDGKSGKSPVPKKKKAEEKTVKKTAKKTQPKATNRKKGK